MLAQHNQTQLFTHRLTVPVVLPPQSTCSSSNRCHRQPWLCFGFELNRVLRYPQLGLTGRWPTALLLTFTLLCCALVTLRGVPVAGTWPLGRALPLGFACCLVLGWLCNNSPPFGLCVGLLGSAVGSSIWSHFAPQHHMPWLTIHNCCPTAGTLPWVLFHGWVGWSWRWSLLWSLPPVAFWELPFEASAALQSSLGALIQGVSWVRAHNHWRAEPLNQWATVGRFEFLPWGIGYPQPHRMARLCFRCSFAPQLVALCHTHTRDDPGCLPTTWVGARHSTLASHM